jgi:hypothetical protein
MATICINGYLNRESIFLLGVFEKTFIFAPSFATPGVATVGKPAELSVN